MRYPFDALASRMECSQGEAARRLGVSGSTWKDYRDNGLSDRVAERLALKAGLHPFEVWPEMAENRAAEARRRTAELARKRYRRPEVAAKKKAAVKAYHESCAEYLNRRRRERYWANVEQERARRMERYYRAKNSAA